MKIEIPNTITAELHGLISRGIKAAEIVNGHLIFTLTDDSTVDVGQVVGAKGDKGDTGETGATGAKGDTGEKGDKGDTGAKGDTGSAGVSISSATIDANGHLILTLTDSTTVDCGNAKGAKGDTGNTGATGNGIVSTVLNADYTLTITFTNGTSYTTASIRGATGATGAAGQNGQDGADGEDGADGFSPIVSSASITGGHTLSVQDATHTESFNVMDGEKGDTGDDGDDGVSVTNVTVNAQNHLICTMSDSTTIDAGEIQVGTTVVEMTAAEVQTIWEANI